MHLRLPIVVACLTLAAGAAAVRTFSQVKAPPIVALSGPGGSFAAPSGATRSASSASAFPAATGRRRAALGATAPRASLVVYVAGEVARPGLYTLRSPARADDAVRAAGGARDDADLVAVNLAAPLADGDEVALYPRGAVRSGRSRGASAGFRGASSRAHRTKKKRRKRRVTAGGSASGGGTGEAVESPIDLNAATATDLATLPGIGDMLAQRIVTVRETSGPFASLDDLLDVGGMTVSKVDALAPFVTLHSAPQSR